MGRKSNLKKLRKQFGKDFSKTAKQLMRKADLVGHSDRTIDGRPYTTIYNPVKHLLKMKPYKSDIGKQILAGTVEKYGNFISQKTSEKEMPDVTTTSTN